MIDLEKIKEYSNKFCLGSELFEEEEKVRKEMNRQIETATEQLLFNDIIDIYNNKYSKYDDYYKYIVDYNTKARESNTPKISGYCESYRFTFTPLKRILLIRQFNYIRELGLKANPRYEQLERDVKRHNNIINKLGFNIWDFVDNNNSSMSVNKDNETICFLADGFYKQDYTLEELRKTIKQILNDYYNVVEEWEAKHK